MTIDREHAEAMLDDFEDHPDKWEIVREVPPAPSGHQPKVTVALRLDRATLDLVKAAAEEQGVGYTTLIRDWVEERVRLGPATVTVQPQALARWQQVASRAAEGLRLDIDASAGTVDRLRAFSDLSPELSRLTEEAAHFWVDRQEVRFKDRMQDILELAMLRRVGVGLQDA